MIKRSLNIILIISFICLPRLLSARSAPVPVVVADPVIESAATQTRKVIGRVVSEEAGMISSDVSGLVREVYVREGDIIEKSQPIASLDQRRLELELQLEEAKLATAKANENAVELEFTQAELNFFREEALRDSPAFSKANHEDLQNTKLNAASKLAANRAETAKIQADVALAKLNLARSVIRAPFRGLVAQKMIYPGRYITPGNNLVELINIDKLEIAIDIPREKLAAAQSAKQYSVLLKKGVFSAKLVRQILTENEVSRTITLRLSPEESLKPKLIVNQSIKVLVPTHHTTSTLTIHKDGLLYRKKNYMVFIIKDRQIQAQQIEIGQSIDNRVEVLSGLEIDDLVVVRGNERLQAGQLVDYQLLEATP